MDAAAAHFDDGPCADGGLTSRELDVLAFEKQWWRNAGTKERAIHEKFGISATRYYHLLNGLLDRTEALEVDPVLVNRLRRLRAGRQRLRSVRQLGTDSH